jgi:hypothetical protein
MKNILQRAHRSIRSKEGLGAWNIAYASSVGGGGGSTNVAQILGYQTFNGGTVGSTPTASNPTGHAAWNLTDGGNPNSAISKYSNTFLDTGFTTVMAQAMASGVDAPTWGCGWDFNNGGQNGVLSMGDEIWYSMRVLFPTGFSNATSDGYLKFIRIYSQTSGGTDSGYNDILWQTGNTWISNYEGNPVLHALDSANQHTPVLNVWETYDFYLKLGNTSGTGLVRLWKNKVQVGSDWAFQTLVNATDNVPYCFNGTYWNGGAPQNQTVYTSMTAVAVNCAASGRHDQTYLATDTNGKSLIALGL